MSKIAKTIQGSASERAELVRKGEVRAAARLMRDIDDGVPEATDALRALFPHTGHAYIIGITGSPGAGKSSLTDRLIAQYRKQGKTVGVVAIDPTSPFSGGAILGDRIRMQDHAVDPGVFIRSLATRGSLGGLSRAASDVTRVLDAMGKDVILVETVGVGQDEVDIASLAHTTIVVVVPGMGDDIQAIKAGILEIADVFTINKADRQGADRTEHELRGMIGLRHAVMAPMDHDASHRFLPSEAAALHMQDTSWDPLITRTVAIRNEGFEALVEAIETHRAHLVESGGIQRRETARAKAELLGLLRERLVSKAIAGLAKEKGLDGLAEQIARREADPYDLVETVVARLQ